MKASSACSSPSTAEAKFAFVRRVESAGKTEAASFLRELVEAVPCRIHIVLTGDGVQVTSREQDAWDSRHIFDRVCAEHGIGHWLTKVNHPGPMVRSSG